MSGAADWAKRFETVIADRLRADGSHDIGHFRRVWHQASVIAAKEGGDLEILAAAAWLHDLVNPPKNSPERSRASALSAEAAASILEAAGFPKAKIPAVKHAILAHSFSARIEPETREAMILQDADRLDALGAIGIARSFCTAGQLGTPLFDSDDPLAEKRSLDDSAYALDHFEIKLFRIAESLRTRTAKRIAEQRVDFMTRFIKQLFDEIV